MVRLDKFCSFFLAINWFLCFFYLFITFDIHIGGFQEISFVWSCLLGIWDYGEGGLWELVGIRVHNYQGWGAQTHPWPGWPWSGGGACWRGWRRHSGARGGTGGGCRAARGAPHPPAGRAAPAGGGTARWVARGTWGPCCGVPCTCATPQWPRWLSDGEPTYHKTNIQRKHLRYSVYNIIIPKATHRMVWLGRWSRVARPSCIIFVSLLVSYIIECILRPVPKSLDRLFTRICSQPRSVHIYFFFYFTVCNIVYLFVIFWSTSWKTESTFNSYISTLIAV